MVIIWILLFGIIFLLSNFLSKTIGVENVITAPALLIFITLLVLLIIQSKHNDEIKIKKIKIQLFDLTYIAPLFCFTIINLIFVDFKFNFLSILLMFSVCAMEEIVFRGFLLTYFSKKYSKFSTYISATIFALIHFVNIFSGLDLMFVTIQVICAFSVGLSYNALTQKFDSIVIPYIIHLITNITAIGTLKNPNYIYYICLAVCFIINIGCFIYLNIKSKNKSNTETLATEKIINNENQ